MSRSINQVTLLGNVGSDPKFSTTEGGLNVATFSLATTGDSYKRQDGTEVKGQTQWHRIVVWRNLAKVIRDYVKSGTQMLVNGSIRYRQYDVDGATRYVTEIHATDFVLLGKKESHFQEEKSAEPKSETAVSRDAEEAKIKNEEDLPF